MSDLDFKRLVFASVLGIQYHPKNIVASDLSYESISMQFGVHPVQRDYDVIQRAIEVTKQAVAVFNHAFGEFPEDS